MNWKYLLKEYRNYLKIEKGLSDNTFQGYFFDIERYADYFQQVESLKSPLLIETDQIRKFLHFLVSKLHAHFQMPQLR